MLLFSIPPKRDKAKAHPVQNQVHDCSDPVPSPWPPKQRSHGSDFPGHYSPDDVSLCITAPYLDALCLLHLYAISCYTFSSPFQNQTELRAKPTAKKWLLPTFSPGNFSLRAGLQVLNLIKIRRHKPTALNMSVSQSCQVGGWCQGRGGDLVCGQADAPQGHSQMIAPTLPQWPLTVSLQHKQPCSSPALLLQWALALRTSFEMPLSKTVLRKILQKSPSLAAEAPAQEGWQAHDSPCQHHKQPFPLFHTSFALLSTVIGNVWLSSGAAHFIVSLRGKNKIWLQEIAWLQLSYQC